MAQMAQIIGRSVRATCIMPCRFGRVIQGLEAVPQHKQQPRNRAHADLLLKGQVLDTVLSDAAQGGVVIIPRLKRTIEAKPGKSIALSGIYRMLARHGWRKLAPDTHHPQGDPAAREAWKKNSPATSLKS